MDLLISPLTAELAAQRADDLIAMTVGSDWDNWTADNLLADRAEKWERSLIAWSGEDIVGWAVASRTGEGVHLHHIVVGTQARRRGVGGRLMAALIAASRDCGRLTLKVHPTNTDALRFYRRLGFTEEGTSDTGYVRLARATGEG